MLIILKAYKIKSARDFRDLKKKKKKKKKKTFILDKMSTLHSDKSITKKRKKIPTNYRKFLSSKPMPWEQEDHAGLAESREHPWPYC